MKVKVASRDEPAKNRPVSNTQVAIRTIKQMILENRLPAGSNHLESELALQLGMSRTPVREATLILEAQGLLKVRPRHGVQISAVSIDDMREIYQILTEMEALAAALAAERELDAEEFALAEAAIAQMDEALEADNREAWALADDVFHSELVRLSGNSRIGVVVEMYTNQARRARALTLYMRPAPLQSNRDHRNVLSAIRSGDAAAAKSIHNEHRVQAGRMLIDIMERHRLHQV